MHLKRYPFHLMLAGERLEIPADTLTLPSLRSYVYATTKPWRVAFRVSGSPGDKVYHVYRLTAAETKKERRTPTTVPDDTPAGWAYGWSKPRAWAVEKAEYEDRERSMRSYGFKVTSAKDRRKEEHKNWDPRFRRHFECWVPRDSMTPLRPLPAIPDEEDE